MGADGRYPYPKEVWSPAGGWWAFPKAWRANTAIAALVIAGVSIPLFIFSERNMEIVGEANSRIPWRPNVPVRKD